MIKLKYLIKRVKNINMDNFKNRIEDISKKTGKSKFIITLDVFLCGIKYGAGYMDYWLFKFYEKTAKERKSYITRQANDLLVTKYNKKEQRKYFISKLLFNATFKDYIGREYIVTKDLEYETFEEFIKRHPTVFLKPHDNACGVGIERVDVKDFKDERDLFDYITKGNFDLIEEPLVQCAEMNKLHPQSINTVRICTLRINGETNIFYAALRIGNGGKHVDNYNAGGMAAFVDLKTGTITNSAIDRTGAVHERHPMTNTKIMGFKIPKWNECIELVKEASKIVDGMGYIGWDVCVTEKGPVLVEGNDFPGHDIQIPKFPGDRTGLMSMYNEVIKNNKKTIDYTKKDEKTYV